MMKLAEAIRHAEQVADSYKDTVPDCGCAVEHRQLADWLKELQRYQWIPCSERLPKDWEHVLVCTTVTYTTPIFVDWYVDEIGSWANKGDSVIAWMPLPKPWKGADDDNN